MCDPARGGILTEGVAAMSREKIPRALGDSPTQAGSVERPIEVPDTIDPSDVLEADAPWRVIDEYPDLRAIFWPPED